MKVQFHTRGLSLNAKLRRWLEPPLERLQSFMPVTVAAVVLEHRQDDAPAFRAFVSLAVPGPDIHAEARGHTLEAAWLEVTTALGQQIERRITRQQRQTRAHRQPPRTASRQAGARATIPTIPVRPKPGVSNSM